MDFTTILNYVIPTLITPFITEFIKTTLKITAPIVSWIVVILVSMGAAYLLSLLLQPAMPMTDILKMALDCALFSMGLKAVHKTATVPSP
jgi:hypothetical protein